MNGTQNKLALVGGAGSDIVAVDFDRDGDGVGRIVDVCPGWSDPDQSDFDRDGRLDLVFASLRNRGQELHFVMEADGDVVLKSDNMDLCGDVVQSLAEYLGLDDLKSLCDFPDEIFKMETLLATADDLQSVRQRLSAEMADHSGLIRTLIVRAEDSRLMMDT